MTILNLEKSSAGGSVPRSVFADLHAEKLLAENAVKVLSAPCRKEDILARQEIFRFMESEAFCEWFGALYMSLKLLDRARYLTDVAAHKVEFCALFYEYASAYAAAVESADSSFDAALLRALKRQLNPHLQSSAYIKERLEEYRKLMTAVSDVGLRIGAGGISVRHQSDGGELPICDGIYSAAENIGYSSASVKNGRAFRMSPQLAEAIVKLDSELFGQLEELQEEISPHIDLGILSLLGDMDFYFEIHNLRKKALRLGIPSCYADVSDIPEYRAEGLCDVSLLQKGCESIVPNDVDLREGDGVYFVRGANGGGKTTYIRAAAINLLLFLGGCPVFAKSADIYPFKRVFTHFPENEGFSEGGRLENEVKRLNEAVENAGGDSFLFLNETFSGADGKKGAELSLGLMKTLKERGAFCLYVTLFHDISEGDIPSLTAVVDGSTRTYKIVKSRDSGSSYAADILKKHGLDRVSLLGRLENA